VEDPGSYNASGALVPVDAADHEHARVAAAELERADGLPQRARADRLGSHAVAREPHVHVVAVVGGEVVASRELLRWTPAGYTDRRSRQACKDALLITPPSLVAVLRAGWEGVVPLLHPSAF